MRELFLWHHADLIFAVSRKSGGRTGRGAQRAMAFEAERILEEELKQRVLAATGEPFYPFLEDEAARDAFKNLLFRKAEAVVGRNYGYIPDKDPNTGIRNKDDFCGICGNDVRGVCGQKTVKRR